MKEITLESLREALHPGIMVIILKRIPKFKTEQEAGEANALKEGKD